MFIAKPVIINAGTPGCVHFEKINDKNIGSCIHCDRQVSYDFGEFSEQDNTVHGKRKKEILPYDWLDRNYRYGMR